MRWAGFLAACTAVAAAGLCAPGKARAQDNNVYRFSPVNQYGINVTAAYWNPIIAYVSEKSSVQLQLKIGRSSADTTAFVLAQEVKFVFSNHLFSPDREHLGWKAFGRRLTPPVQSQLIVSDDSPITDLTQLAGNEVAFPGPEALVAYKMSAAHLMSRKIEFKTVFGGKVAAVGANSQLAEGYARREGRKYRVLWSGPPVHDLALMSAAKVPDAHFVASDGSEYASYRDFYRTAPAALR